MDDFSDDGFDELNANALQELENNAIQFTQAQKKFEPSQDDQFAQTQGKREPSQDRFDYDFEDDDLDDAVVLDETRGKPIPILPPEKPAQSSTSRIDPQQAPQPLHDGWGPVPIPASHYRPQPSGTATRTPAQAAIASRPSQAPQYGQIRPPPAPIPHAAPAVPSRYQSTQVPRPTASTSREYAALQAQLEDLKSRLNTKDGEIQIVRKRLEKDRQDHERELQALRKQSTEQLSRQERAVEAAEVAKRKATTELEFTRRDLKEEVDRAKRKEKDVGGTPKKNAAAKAWGVSDGFEDLEMAGSPSKGARGKAAASAVPEHSTRLTRTPTKGKRKRPTIDSPVMALETTDGDDVLMLDESMTAADSFGSTVSVQTTLPAKTASFDFIKVILNHSAAHGRPLAFDYLSGFALPSRPTESLASTVFQKLAVIGNPGDPMRLPIEFCETIIELWDQCFKERCLAPITELVSLISFTLQLHTISVAPYIAQSLLPIATSSCYEVAIPRFHSTNTTGDPTDESWKNFATHIATTDILSLLYLTALGCATSPPIRGAVSSPIVDFWSSVHPEFVLMLLSHKQPVADFVTVLRLLQTSVFDDTIGPIAPERKTPEQVASTVVERVSFYLVETPRWEIGLGGLRAIRREILRTLATFARGKFGMRSLALHEYAVPRLVVFLCSLIDEMYDGGELLFYSAPPSPLPMEEPSEANRAAEPLAVAHKASDEVQVLISQTMLLLHTIITDKTNKNIVNVSGKLAKFTGGPQKYLLSLARLNFADVEEGVKEETAELAHELLELAVTEEEGAELGEFFGG